ncbi:Hypothetical protein HVR_LOCUS26 [uncultured virus]|nr:Hypothetical protein HVR_LOCUS26 [uncultured virus]
MPLGTKFVEDMSFVEMLFVIVLGWILVALWQRCIDNLTFNSLGLNKDSTYHTFVIALVATTIFLVFVFTFNSILGDVVESDIAGGFTPPATPGTIESADINVSSNEDTILLSEPPPQCGYRCTEIF